MVIGRIRSAGGVAGAIALFLLLVPFLLIAWPAAAQPLQDGSDYLLIGAPTDQPMPVRACTPEVLARLTNGIEIAAPAGGWSGVPQAVDVFNVFNGEVMIAHGDRRICGNMQDSRTRDSRFRAGVGLVVVPPPGDVEPIHVAWEKPLKARWVPVVHMGGPSPVQQLDMARLLVRAACMAIALALALSALMGFVTTRDRDFLVYILACTLLVVWQAVLNGLGGYPEPWLPIGGATPWWMVSAPALSISVVGWVLWRMCGGLQTWPRSRAWALGLVWLLVGLALLAPLLSWEKLAWLAATLDHASTLICALVLAAGVVSLRRGDFHAVDGIAAALPLLVMALADLAGSNELLRFRVEAVQLAMTWFLMSSAYGLNRRIGRLRRQRDEMRQLADTDALTGLPNRRAGLRQLERYLRHAQQAGLPLSIGFLDIDLFKQINDRFGHEIGDAVLVSVASTLVGAVRNRDDVIRMGGEEFLILLPGSRSEVALPRLEQLREKIGRQAAELGHDGLAVTVSIGLAEMRSEDDDLAELLRRADTAMYRAKRGGRNRVVGLRDDLEIA